MTTIDVHAHLYDQRHPLRVDGGQIAKRSELDRVIADGNHLVEEALPGRLSLIGPMPDAPGIGAVPT
jgi:hypothetical protein